MNERTLPGTNGMRLAMVTMVALLLALAAVLALSIKPAEAAVFAGGSGGSGGGGGTTTRPANDNFSAAKSLTCMKTESSLVPPQTRP
jgi:hypothetical protein